MRAAVLFAALLVSSLANATGVGPVCNGTGSCQPGTTRHLYITTAGNDSTGTGSSTAPWATMDKARSVIRTKRYNKTGNTLVTIGAGDYQRTAVVFQPADAGFSGHTVTYQSASVGTAHLMGGETLSGWVLDAGNVSKVAHAAVYALWENGKRARMARTPNLVINATYPTAFAPYFTGTGVDSNYGVLNYNAVDFDPSTWTLADIRLFSWGAFGGHEIDWFSDLAGASALNTVTHQFTLTNGGMKFPAFSVATGGRYFVQGPRQLLDQCGEFAATGGFIYYWPCDGAIASQTIVAPTTQRVISFVGASASSRVRNIKLDGLFVEYSDRADWYRYGYCCTNGSGEGHADAAYDYFATVPAFKHGGIFIQNADHITVSRTHVKNTGFAGIFIDGVATGHAVQHSWIEHTGGDGITVNGQYPGEGDTSRDNRISDDKINNFGEVDGAGKGITLRQSGHNIVEYQDISLGPNNGLWIHGDYQVPAANNYANHNYVHHIKVDKVDQDAGDRGAVGASFMSAPNGSTCPVGSVNTFDQLVISNAAAHPSMGNVLPNCVFFDNEGSCQVMSNVDASTNCQGGQQRYNDACCATFTNVTWTGVFDSAKVDYTHIGTTSSFPY